MVDYKWRKRGGINIVRWEGRGGIGLIDGKGEWGEVGFVDGNEEGIGLVVGRERRYDW